MEINRTKVNMYKYVITGNGYKALSVHSDMNILEIQDYIRSHSKKIHEDSHDTVFSWAFVDFVNPRVMLVSDFVDFLPALIG
jgi:hypothetical protein